LNSPPHPFPVILSTTNGEGAFLESTYHLEEYSEKVPKQTSCLELFYFYTIFALILIRNTLNMAKKKSDKETVIDVSPSKSYFSFLRNETFHFIIGLSMVIFAIYMLLAFLSFFFTGAADQSIIDSGNPADLSAVNNHVRNYAGSRGAQLASFLINDCFGFASFFILVFLTVAGFKLMKVRSIRLWKWFFACSLLLIWFSLFLGFAFMSQYQDSFIYWGGRHGYNVSLWLTSQIGEPGVALVLLITAVLFFIYISSKTIEWLRKLLGFQYLKRKKREKTAPEPEAEKTEAPAEAEAEPATDEPFTDAETPSAADALRDIAEAQSESLTDPQPTEVELSLDTDDMEVVAPADDTVDTQYRAEDARQKDEESVVLTPAEQELLKSDAEKGGEPDFEIEAGGDPDEENYQPLNSEPYNPKLDLENYHFPTLDLLKTFENNEPTINMEEQNANKNKIIATLRSFGIEISTIKATVGPTVTLYEITPEQGVRISKIRGLEDDIALSLAALGIRIIAPIPGKGTIGIEVPNSNPKIVSGQSIIGSRKFQESTYDLPIAFGKTITNDVFMVDLCKMPHVLVAGATGQGKSVGLNAIITSLLYKKHPAELKFVLVDPKKVEFSIYSVIENHFLAKLPGDGDAIITDVTKVVQTLNSVCVEMDTRYDLLKAAHVRNIKEYNEKFINRKLNPEKGHKYMPYIVVVIDEFGDLIMTAGKEIELPIARIAQLARAVGIHMIIATQRPTTNIITGTIKANFPARVAFRVSAMMDSRTILDRPGANQLIGRGDMLFLQGADPVRVQCAFIDTPEVEEITKYIARQQGYPTPFYLPEAPDADGAGGEAPDVDMGKLDPLFEEAARLIVIHQQGSTSLIQRKFSIGYNRAGRLMDQLEKAGIVGPIQGSKPREVLCVDETDLDNRLQNIL
jgi:S-DNA-T family DNA segregation ATPase FtsK/SpoIIIE